MSDNSKVFWKYQFPAILWGALIFLASSIPSARIPSVFLLSYDKLIHGIIFLVLGMLVYRAIGPKITPMVFAGTRVLISIGIVVLYGAIDELHQGMVPGRSVDVLDLVADASGGLLAALCIFLYARWKAGRNELSPS